MTDAAGDTVESAKLQLFQLVDDGFCDSECVPAPRLRGVFSADERGIVPAVVLPAP